MGDHVTYIPDVSAMIPDGAITAQKLGGDITAEAKRLLRQDTPAKMRDVMGTSAEAEAIASNKLKNQGGR